MYRVMHAGPAKLEDNNRLTGIKQLNKMKDIWSLTFKFIEQ